MDSKMRTTTLYAYLTNIYQFQNCRISAGKRGMEDGFCYSSCYLAVPKKEYFSKPTFKRHTDKNVFTETFAIRIKSVKNS